MAPSGIVDALDKNDLAIESRSGFINGSTAFVLTIACLSVVLIAGSVFWILICGCCGAKGGDKDQKKAAADTVAEGEKSAKKGTEVEKAAEVKQPEPELLAEKKTMACTLKGTMKGKAAEGNPAYMDMGPAAGTVRKAPAEGVHYFDVSVKPVSKKPPPMPADQVPRKTPAYRTMYGMGDDFESTEIKQAKKGKQAYLTLCPEAAEACPVVPDTPAAKKNAYLTMAPELVEPKATSMAPAAVTKRAGGAGTIAPAMPLQPGSPGGNTKRAAPAGGASNYIP